MDDIRGTVVRFIISYYKENRFYPDYDEIAAGVGRAKSTVFAYMKKLEDEGIVVRKADHSPQYRLINMDFICREGKTK